MWRVPVTNVCQESLGGEVLPHRRQVDSGRPTSALQTTVGGMCDWTPAVAGAILFVDKLVLLGLPGDVTPAASHRRASSLPGL
jgi:hypothetical protein